MNRTALFVSNGKFNPKDQYHQHHHHQQQQQQQQQKDLFHYQIKDNHDNDQLAIFNENIKFKNVTISIKKKDDNEDEVKFDWKNLPLVILYNIFGYLTSADRLKASSACKAWRNVIYNSTLWPKKHLKVNLCPHKFIPNFKDKNSSGFHTFHLNDSFLYQRHLDVACLPFRNDYTNRKKPNRKNFNEQLKSFIQKCSRFLNGITFYFDPNSSHNVLDLIKIIKFFSENEIANYELNDTGQNYYANCRNLKYFSIVPVTTLVRCASDQRFMSLYSGLTEAIRFLFSKCNQLEHVSFGNLHELIHSADTFFVQFFKTDVNQKLKCLHLGSIKGDIFRYIPQQTTLDHLEKFQNLKHLSLDFDVLNTKVINTLSRISSLRTLSINVHRFYRNHPGISNEAWIRIVNKIPKLGVTLNLLHTESISFRVIIDSLLNTQMPLKDFKAYYLEFKDDIYLAHSSILCNMLDVIGRTHMNSLESFTLVDNLNCPKSYLKAVTPNVLVMLSWRCRNLNNLTIIGYEVTDIDIIAIARLRGNSLQAFRFPACCIQLSQIIKYNFHLDEFFTNFEFASQSEQRIFRNAVSEPLKRNWQPIATNQIPDIIASGFLPQTTYHRTIIEQNDVCTH